MRDYKKLSIWQRSLDFSIKIYEKTRQFPADERFGLTSQLRRAATSIPINIAEGCGRDTNRDFAHFIHIAEGSACEVECELIIAHRVNYLSQSDYAHLAQEIDEIKRMIASFKIKVEGDFK
ncbi:MAG: four helix bundle protein [Muribaculaceae bacterium]|nr:four helix bundle protein [Muribaculaceae bacterium]